MSRPIVNTGGPGKVAADARTFSIACVVLAVGILFIFVALNHGFNWPADPSMTTGTPAHS